MWQLKNNKNEQMKSRLINASPLLENGVFNTLQSRYCLSNLEEPGT
jgi:hypothetical protein